MYKIIKTPCPERERTWILSIDGHAMGIAEVVFMTDSLRSTFGQFKAFTKDFEPINVSYDCNNEKLRVSYTINNFIADIQAAIKGKELHFPRMISEDAPEQLYTMADVNESNVDEVAVMLNLDTPYGWETQTNFQKVGYVHTFLRDERLANMEHPMLDLVQRSKLAKTRATKISVHMKNMY